MRRTRLIRARQKAGLSQSDLAKKCGIDKGHLSRIESGERNPSLEMMRKLLAALGKTSLDLFIGSAA